MNTNEEVRGDRSLFHSRKRQLGARDRGDGIRGWNVLSSTRWQTKAAAPADICAFGDYCHRLRRSRSTVGCDFARDTRATTAVEAAVSAAMGLDSAGDTPATTNAYPSFRAPAIRLHHEPDHASSSSTATADCATRPATDSGCDKVTNSSRKGRSTGK